MTYPWPIRSVIAGAVGTATMTAAYDIERRLRHATTPLDYDDSLVPGKIVAGIMHLPHVTDREDADSKSCELRLDSHRLLLGLKHDGDRGDPFALRVELVLERARATERLEQLEVHVAHECLGPAQLELGSFASIFAVVHDHVAVGLEDPPGSPAEGLVVRLHLRLEVADDQ